MSPMAQDFLATFVGSRDRARVLRLFIFNLMESFTIQQIAKRSGVSARAVAEAIKELERFGIVKKGMLSIQVGVGKRVEGKQKEQMWAIDQEFRYLRAVSSFVHEVSPIPNDEIINALKSSGKFSTIILSGVFVGDPSRPVDLLLAADMFHETRLERAIRELEPMLGRDIRYAVFTTPEFRYRLTIQDRLIRDTLDYPHLVLLDKAGFLVEA